jgi:hypothetical protein
MFCDGETIQEGRYMKEHFGALVLLAACAVDPSAEQGAGDQVVAPSFGQHCVVSPSSEITCFDSFTDAIATATGGEIQDAQTDAAVALADPGFAARINAIAARQDPQSALAPGGVGRAAMVVIGISYKDGNYGGNTWVWLQPTRCDFNSSTVDFEVPNLNTSPYSGSGFNDSISSFRSFNNCLTVLFEDWFYGGAVTSGGVPTLDMSYVGNAMNDRASSIRWY